MRLSLEHTNPVVFWAIAINTYTSVGTLAQGLHPAYQSRILQVPFLRQNRPLWRLFRQQAEGKCQPIHAFTLGKSLHRASGPIVNRSTRVCVAETRYAHFIQHLPQLGMRAKCQTREADG